MWVLSVVLSCYLVPIVLWGIYVIITGNLSECTNLRGRKARLIGLLVVLLQIVLVILESVVSNAIEQPLGIAVIFRVIGIGVFVLVIWYAVRLDSSEEERKIRPAHQVFVCCRCGKSLSEPRTGIYVGGEIASAILTSPYPCKSCGTIFCVDCLSAIQKRNRLCPSCNRDVGW